MMKINKETFKCHSNACEDYITQSGFCGEKLFLNSSTIIFSDLIFVRFSHIQIQYIVFIFHENDPIRHKLHLITIEYIILIWTQTKLENIR